MKGGEREEGGREGERDGRRERAVRARARERESREAECHTEDGWGRNADVPHIG